MSSKKPTFPLTQAMPKPDKAQEDYETQGHLKTILDAHEIMNDPVKLKKVHALAGRHRKALSSLKDLKDHYQEKYGKPQDHSSNSQDDKDEDGE